MGILKEISTVVSVAMPIQEDWTVRRCRYAPEGESVGRLCLATGIHGDEMMGQLIAFGVGMSMIIGGLLAVNTALGRAIDATLDSRLEQQRETFRLEAELPIS